MSVPVASLDGVSMAASDATEPLLGLDRAERDLIDFERSWWRHGGSKERAVRARFGLSSTRYHQLLMRTIDLPQALTYDPVLVRRLRRLREARRLARFVGRLGSFRSAG